MSAPHPGQFITVEGGEGAGKTTNLAAVRQCLQRHGIEPLMTREPGGTGFAEALRATLLEPRTEPVAPLAETLVMFAARAQHLDTVIKPALDAGRWVVCDRFTDATYAYQGGGRGVPESQLEMLEQMVHPDLQPALTLFLDVPVATAMARIAHRGLDRIESEEAAFFESVRRVYAQRAERFARFVTIDASRPLDDVEAAVTEAVERFVEAVAPATPSAPQTDNDRG